MEHLLIQVDWYKQINRIPAFEYSIPNASSRGTGHTGYADIVSLMWHEIWEIKPVDYIVQGAYQVQWYVDCANKSCGGQWYKGLSYAADGPKGSKPGVVASFKIDGDEYELYAIQVPRPVEGVVCYWWERNGTTMKKDEVRKVYRALVRKCQQVLFGMKFEVQTEPRPAILDPAHTWGGSEDYGIGYTFLPIEAGPPRISILINPLKRFEQQINDYMEVASGRALEKNQAVAITADETMLDRYLGEAQHARTMEYLRVPQRSAIPGLKSALTSTDFIIAAEMYLLSAEVFRHMSTGGTLMEATGVSSAVSAGARALTLAVEFGVSVTAFAASCFFFIIKIEPGSGSGRVASTAGSAGTALGQSFATSLSSTMSTMPAIPDNVPIVGFAVPKIDPNDSTRVMALQATSLGFRHFSRDQAPKQGERINIGGAPHRVVGVAHPRLG
ncbi:hypothetical protein GTC6_03835 [Gordonia terrae C-6]|uniref:Uncharacterized protein n=1 Tax=Gordonia terrae C-6 TaxID=1316928 RepID=R7YDM2_9ACTN|nr:hypothetical protein [Gordonia terrae]EON34077.1 hypothetical protein GTC6_03835 [Gordonia terrae C-6]